MISPTLAWWRCTHIAVNDLPYARLVALYSYIVVNDLPYARLVALHTLAVNDLPFARLVALHSFSCKLSPLRSLGGAALI